MDEIRKVALVSSAIEEMALAMGKLVADPATLLKENNEWVALILGDSIWAKMLRKQRDDGFDLHMEQIRVELLALAKANMDASIEEAYAVQKEYINFLGWAQTKLKELTQTLEESYKGSRPKSVESYPELVEYLDRQQQEMLAHAKETHYFFTGIGRQKYELRLKSCFILLSDETVRKFVELYQIELELEEAAA